MALSRLSFSIIAIVMLFLGTANATTSTINPNVPAQNSLLQSSVVRGNFAAAYSDINNIYGLISAASRSLQFDPRAYGAICGGENTFAGNGVTKTFNYTIPFIGSTSTDNTGFMVFYENASGGGTATILNTAQFTVTGVNSGAGGTITLLGSPVPSGSVLIVAHDDSAGLVSASLSSTAVGGYVVSVDGCTIYGSQSTGTVLAEGTQLVGPNYTANYGYQGQGPKPILRVIAPTGFAPNFGINIGDKAQQAFKGFEITADVPGYQSLAFQSVPVLIGSNSTGGAGAGQVPGIVLENMTVNYGRVGFGAPIGGNSGYIFASVRNSNFLANNAGMYGPLSDLHLEGNDFASNGQFGSFGNSGGLVMGPAQAAPGAGGAGHSAHNRFEYNSSGAVMKAGFLMSFSDTEFDCNSQCGLDLDASWGQINITGGWFRCNGNNGAGGTGSTTPGQDAHICINGPGKNLHVENVNFLSGYARGYQAPIGSANANTPAYLLDVNTAGSGVDNISINGNAQGVAGNDGAYVTDFAIYRNGKPSNVKINLTGQAASGNTVNGNNLAQSRELPANTSTRILAFGGPEIYNEQNLPLNHGFVGQLAKRIGSSPTYDGINSFSTFDCDLVNQKIIPDVMPSSRNEPLVLWQTMASDPTYGGGFYQGHLTDTNSCHMGGLAWLSMPTEFKTFAQSTGCVTAGSWANDSSYGGKFGVTSHTNGDTLSCVVSNNEGSNAVYLWYQMRGANGGTFTYSVDTGLVATVATQGQNQFTFPIDSTSRTMGAVRIPVFGSGAHTIYVTVSSSTNSANTVTIEGVGVPPGLPYHGAGPSVFFGGQVFDKSGTYAAAVTAFNQAEKDQVSQMASDGLPISFSDVEKYLNISTDYGWHGQPNLLNASGQKHIADAYDGKMQSATDAGFIASPLDYGASCNSIFFSDTYVGSTHYSVHTTAGSPVISIDNYNFQPGVATKNGGGDVGKRFCVAPGTDGGDEGPCTYIASVNTTANTATLGRNMVNNKSQHNAMMGGYPTNPNDPSTAQDDTMGTQAAGAAAQINGGKVVMPNNCMVHDLNMPQDIIVEGNAPGAWYLEKNQELINNPQTTVLNCGITGFSSDSPQCIRAIPFVRWRNLLVRGPTFPYTPPGISAACFGYSTSGTGNGGPSAQALMDHMSFFGCPVDVGQAYGYNHPVTFTASVDDNGDGTSTMHVTSIDSANFNTADAWSNDFLALNRPVSGTGVTANTTITYVPPGSGVGDYIINKGFTISSRSLTSAANALGMELFDEFSQHIVGGMGYNGVFTDSVITGSTCTGTFMNSCWRMGPDNGTGFGNGGNRWVGGRIEEMEGTGAVVCEGCGVTLTGVDIQFNGTYNVKTLGTNSTVQVTGGQMYAGGHCHSGSQDKAMVQIGGTGASVSVDGVALSAADFGSGCGGSTGYLFSTATGATPGQIDVMGGNTSPTGNTVTGLFNWTNGTPAKYKQDTTGWPVIDTTVGYTATGCGASAPKGGASSGLVTTSATGSCSLTLTLPSNTNGWNCSGNDNTLGGAFTKSSGSATTCVLTGTTTGGSTIGFQAAPIGGP